MRAMTLGRLLEEYLDSRDSQGLTRRKINAQVKPVLAYFAPRPVAWLTTERIDEYRRYRHAKQSIRGGPISHATINRELTYLRAALNRAHRSGRLAAVPWFPMTRETSKRVDFCPREKFEKIMLYLRENSPPVADLVEFYYHTGWRSREAMDLAWEEVKWEDKLICLPPERNKGKEPRVFPIVGPLEEVLNRRRQVAAGPWVFHRKGHRIKAIRRVWENATKAAGCPGLCIHGFRRTFARNQMLAGVPQPVTMELAGWKSDSIYRRYAIVDENALQAGVEKMQRYLEQ